MNNLTRIVKRNWLWCLYLLFVTTALATHSGEAVFTSSGPYAAGKIFCWLLLAGFLVYSLQISHKENFFHSLRRMNPILWSRQIGLDLYIGLMLPLFLIFLNEGSVVVMLIWFLPIFVFANLATLLYFALNYDSIVAHFIT
ncbi:MAG: hypothetical protein HKN85_03840 [Gammaproteobacteria bacterium]|nr:hypothetical protein [Gammaproteobacteria bacterium]